MPSPAVVVDRPWHWTGMPATGPLYFVTLPDMLAGCGTGVGTGVGETNGAGSVGVFVSLHPAQSRARPASMAFAMRMPETVEQTETQSRRFMRGM